MSPEQKRRDRSEDPIASAPGLYDPVAGALDL